MSKLVKTSLWKVKISHPDGVVWNGNFIEQPGFFDVLDAVSYEEGEVELRAPANMVAHRRHRLKTAREILEQLSAPLSYVAVWHRVRVAGTEIGCYKVTCSEVFVHVRG